MHAWVIGVDLGATKVALGLIDPFDRIVATERIPTRAEEGAHALVERIAGCAETLSASIPEGQRVAALGLCAPGPVEHEAGLLVDPPNLPTLHHTPLRAMLSERLALPVCLEHDAKAAALGEFHYGAGRGARGMVYIVVGTGVGAAIIADGRLYRGPHNAAGEVGHITLDHDGEVCSCGNRGCVETFLSGPWLARRYARAMAGHAAGPAPLAPSLCREGAEDDSTSRVSAEEVTERARAGNPLARRVLAQAGEALGAAVATLAMLLDIDLYVVGGSVALAGDLLLEPARHRVPHCAYRSVSERVRIVASRLDVEAPIRGCGWLARQCTAQGAEVGRS